jgi:hypothetical protein
MLNFHKQTTEIDGQRDEEVDCFHEVISIRAAESTSEMQPNHNGADEGNQDFTGMD